MVEVLDGSRSGEVLLGGDNGSARAALLLVHERGGTAERMVSAVARFAPPGFATVAPQAAGKTWYPHRFVAELETNEPALSESLSALEAALGSLHERGFRSKQVVLVGFSQGACLALEFVAAAPSAMAV